ncbi:hypothetical protein G6F63_016254 [Rhizopus arrhizus]|nr:hypothetical protein G6F63_016254 [Rhizopus arrhizus]
MGTRMQWIVAALRQRRGQRLGQRIDQQRLFRPHPRPRPHQPQWLGGGQADARQLQPSAALAGNFQLDLATPLWRQ